jgi:hypothetical protein
MAQTNPWHITLKNHPLQKTQGTYVTITNAPTLTQAEQAIVSDLHYYADRQLIPAGIAVHAEGVLDPTLQHGEIKITVGFGGHSSPAKAPTPRAYPPLNNGVDEQLAASIKLWNVGEEARTHVVRSNLFEAEMIEPYVKWEGGIGWRPTKGNERTLKK